MAEHDAQKPARRRGNPNWVKGGASPNPLGRPRTGLACAEAIRSKVDPAEWVDFELEVARDTKQPLEKRAAAWHALVDRGYPRPATTSNVNFGAGVDDAEPDLSRFTTAELALWLELREKAQSSAGAATDPRSTEAPHSDDDRSQDTTSRTHDVSNPAKTPEAA